MSDPVIISDTSCLIALDLIQSLDLLHQLFPTIITTPQVREEFGSSMPEWIAISSPTNNQQLLELEHLLDKGEASAIALALETPNCVLIIDEKKGRNIAIQLQIKIFGTLKVLLLAKEKGIIKSIAEKIEELKLQGFRISDILIEALLKEAKESN